MIIKSQLLTVVLREIVKPQFVTMVLRKLLLKSQLVTVVLREIIKPQFVCGFKEMSISFKTTVTNGGFLHLKSMWMLTWTKKTTLTNIFKWILFLSFFFYK